MAHKIRVNTMKPIAQPMDILPSSSSIPFLFPPNKDSAPPDIVPRPAVLPDWSKTVEIKPMLAIICNTRKKTLMIL
jgi:hypothetical protein